MCAEQSAIAAAIAAGERDFVRLVIVTDADVPTVPCGRCRQLLAEFCQDIEIHTSTTKGKSAEYSLRGLLPLPTQGILTRS
jgi:cytidine deaminase